MLHVCCRDGHASNCTHVRFAAFHLLRCTRCYAVARSESLRRCSNTYVCCYVCYAFYVCVTHFTAFTRCVHLRAFCLRSTSMFTHLHCVLHFTRVVTLISRARCRLGRLRFAARRFTRFAAARLLRFATRDAFTAHFARLGDFARVTLHFAARFAHAR